MRGKMYHVVVGSYKTVPSGVIVGSVSEIEHVYEDSGVSGDSGGKWVQVVLLIQG
jgi:hypothetical protein